MFVYTFRFANAMTCLGVGETRDARGNSQSGAYGRS